MSIRRFRPTTLIPSSVLHRSHGSSNATPLSQQTAFLECERKFNVTDLLRTHLNAGHSIQNLHFTKKSKNLAFHDSYYDWRGLLCDKGIWLRLRTPTYSMLHPGVWEAKLGLGMWGEYINSQCEEVSGAREVLAAIEKRVLGFEYKDLMRLRHENSIAKIYTEREVWNQRVLDGEGDALQIVFDTVTAHPRSAVENANPLEHVIGEVETTKMMQQSDYGRGNDRMKKEELARMDRLLEDFMVDQDLFPTHPAPVGKLSAYFEWEKENQKDPVSAEEEFAWRGGTWFEEQWCKQRRAKERCGI